MEKTPHCGYAAILGAPNAGKSTLLNALVGVKVAIVSPKVQTTRNRILGILNEGESQVIFIDTPGVFNAKKPFEQAMVSSAFSALADANVVLFVRDAAARVNEGDALILEKLKTVTMPVWLVLNKTELVEKPDLLALAKALHEQHNFDRSFMISAKRAAGVRDISNALAQAMPQGPWLYPDDEATTMSMRELAAETTREKIFIKLRQELPYGAMVETESWNEDKTMIRMGQVIHVERDAHKKMVLGAAGAMLKSIGTAARKDMEEQFGKKIHLSLFVRVTPGWKDDKAVYQRLGLEFKG